MEYSLADAAKAAKVAKSTVLRAVRAGRLSARREEDGTYRIDASELARIYDLQHLTRTEGGALNHNAPGGGADAPADPGWQSGTDLVRLELRMVKDQLAREREDRERERETMDDLRKRLDSEQAERRSLQLRLTPPEPQQSPAMVEELRRRLEEAEARIQALSAPPAPQMAQERPVEVPTGATPAKDARGFLGRLLGW